MGLELVIAPDSPDQDVVSLATTKGWYDVSRYVLTLNRKTYPRLHVLARQGYSDDCEALQEEIANALVDHPPKNPEVTITLEDLLDNLEGRGPVSCYIGDPPDDDEDD
ncbi:MAG: hypothetical protein KatS3mg108_2439 [Isosphaeraceae bacterium]|jgi:hypothetical protein|nr:MAG: hypothetical protein KatS3mg108_2439 [Isosphaeraceae bacterium]